MAKPPKALDIVFENRNLVALNKPSGLITIPDREGKEQSLKDLLLEKYSEIYTVHRIDRETSGLVIFAKNPESHRFYNQQFENRQTIKIYTGFVIGSLQQKEGTVNAPIAENMLRRGTMLVHQRGKQAVTDYKVLQDFGVYSYLQFQIHTGRTHQIRVHTRELGHPLVADALYGDGKPLLLSTLKSKYNLSKQEWEEKPLLNRLALHAYQLTITDTDNSVLQLEAPVHKDFKATLQQLEKTSVKK